MSRRSPRTALASSPRVLDQPALKPWAWCPKARRELWNPQLREWEQQGCDTNRCSGCAAKRAYKLKLAIEAAAPTHWIMLTFAGPTWKVANARWAKLRRRLKNEYSFSAAYVVERAKGSSELHLHVLWRGDLVPTDQLSEAAQLVGFGRVVGVGELWHPEGAAHYLMKQVRDERLLDHLEINGGQLIHALPGFWELDGSPYPGGWIGVARALRRRGVGARNRLP